MRLNGYHWSAGLLLALFVHAWALAQFLPERISSATAGGGAVQPSIQVAFGSLPGMPSRTPKKDPPNDTPQATNSNTEKPTENEIKTPALQVRETRTESTINSTTIEPIVKPPLKSAKNIVVKKEQERRVSRTPSDTVSEDTRERQETSQSSHHNVNKTKSTQQSLNDSFSSELSGDQPPGSRPATEGDDEGTGTPGIALKGQGAKNQALVSYEAKLLAWLEKHKRYPKKALRKRIEGEGVIYFKIDRSGSVLAQELRDTTGSRILDREALAMLKRAAPMPSVPGNQAGTEFEFVLPVTFNIKVN